MLVSLQTNILAQNKVIFSLKTCSELAILLSHIKFNSLTFFWANIFVCKDTNILHVLKFNNTLRTYALGNFVDFVKAISRSASMLKYLNNNRNFKKKPNENFARELMELFTLGIGNYTESDIKEAARAYKLCASPLF